MSFKSSSMRLKYRNIIQIFTTFALLPPTYCSSWVRCWSTLLVSPLGWCGPLLTARVASKFWLKLAMQMMKFSRFDRLHILYIVHWSEFCRKLLCVEFGFCVYFLRGGLARPQLSRELSKRLDLRRRWLFNIYVVFPHSADCQNSNIATSLALVPLVQ